MKKLECFLFIKDKRLESKISDSLLKFNSITILDKINDNISLIEKCRYFTPKLLIIQVDEQINETIETISMIKKIPFLIAISDNKINSLIENLFFDTLPNSFTSELLTKKIYKLIRLFDFMNNSSQEIQYQYVSEKKNAYPTAQERKIDNYIFLKNKKKAEKILFENIYFIQSKQSNITFFLNNGKNITLISSLKKIQNQLPKNQFVKISNSLIINIYKMESLSKNIIHIESYRLPVTRTYLPNLKYILQL